MYKLTVTQAHVKLMIEALDLYSRVGCGQYQEVLNTFGRLFKVPNEKREALGKACREIKEGLTDLSDGYYSITSNETPEKAKISYELMKVLMHKIAWEEHPEGGHLHIFDGPMKITKEPLATIKKEETSS